MSRAKHAEKIKNAVKSANLFGKGMTKKAAKPLFSFFRMYLPW